MHVCMHVYCVCACNPVHACVRMYASACAVCTHIIMCSRGTAENNGQIVLSRIAARILHAHIHM